LGENSYILKFQPSIGLDESVRRDVAEIKNAPFFRKDLLVVGYALDIDTGLLREVVNDG
jgi:carbonic anhydrase